MNGYLHEAYAASFAELGAPRKLPRCGGWLLERRIPGSPFHDAMGCYPVFACHDWQSLAKDLQELPEHLVTVTLVTDAFCPLTRAQLERLFDYVRPLGTHHVIDLPGYSENRLTPHHRRTLRRARRYAVRIGLEPSPAAFLDDWMRLYENLIDKHHIAGLRHLSRNMLGMQLSVPGAVLFSARSADRAIGAHWYYLDAERVYGHLAAFTSEGYEASASYLLQSAAIDYFATRATVIDYGGAPTIAARDGRGLDRFKVGWGSRPVPAYLCGMVLKPGEYARLGGVASPMRSDFFPAYRRGEIK